MRLVGRRLLFSTIPTLLLLVFIVSVLVRLMPGSAVDIMLQESSGSAEQRERLAESLGLNRSVPEQYFRYLRDVVTGSMGYSMYDGRPVRQYIQARAAPTIQLTVMALSVSTIVGIGVGLISAVRRGSRLDVSLRLFVSTALGIPNFVMATLVILLPAYYLQWSPPLQFVRITADPVKNLLFFIAPTFTLGLALAASVARITRTSTLEVLNEDYIRTARSKGLAESTVIGRHVLRNALMPVMTLLGLQVAVLMSGVVVTESIFSIPGLGTLLLRKIAERDYPVVQGLTLTAGIIVIFVNLVIDVAYTYVNPRLSS